MASTTREQESSARPKPVNSKPRQVRSSHIITENIEVGVPAQSAYDAWTQYDKWSQMFKRESADKGRKSRRRESEDDGDVKVSSKIGPSRREWSVEIVDEEPGQRLSWRSKGGLKAEGTTTFHSIDDRLTRVMVEIEYKPSGVLETVGNFFRMQRRRVRKNLRLFKNYVELRGNESRSEEES